MRRQGGHYGGDSGSDGGAAAEMHQQHQNRKCDYYQRRHQEQQLLGKKEGAQHHNQWRWERDGAHVKLPQSAMSPTTLGNMEVFELQDGLIVIRETVKLNVKALIRACQIDWNPNLEDTRLLPRTLHVFLIAAFRNLAYNKLTSTTIIKFDFRSRKAGSKPLILDKVKDEKHLDPITKDGGWIRECHWRNKRILDDIMKLSKEQTDAEDAENARHKERVSSKATSIPKVAMEQYPTSRLSPNDPRVSNEGPSPFEEPNRAYNSDYHDSYRERGRFPGNARDHGYEPKDPYPRGRAYDTGSRYY
ncbi:hypothetical protein BUALT_Bualt02G0019100 [Buddleja alternifolia]|uniref:Uncharacterized protein n=1 Tax=Buddleja alternifolia TaxID=168488 RepID=A0AAV6Y7I8_9LAMI|nr:hypothetical protein BUALT_Bualt02G0019100 [Buddleja alternifolia]